MARTTETPTMPGALKRARKAAGFSNARDFLAAVKAEQGKAPSYSTYAQWESGEVEPRDESLTPIRGFHTARETWIEPATAPDLATALADLARELAANREERTALAAQVADLTATVETLVQEVASARGSEARGANGAPAGSAG